MLPDDAAGIQDTTYFLRLLYDAKAAAALLKAHAELCVKNAATPGTARVKKPLPPLKGFQRAFEKTWSENGGKYRSRV